MTRATIEDYVAVDVWRLGKLNLLEPGKRGRLGWKVDGQFVGTLSFMAGPKAVEVAGDVGELARLRPTTVALTETAVGFGTRRWFSCPSCERRSRHLYVNLDALVCRVCLGAPYLSESLSKPDRQQDRLTKARRRLYMDAHGQAHRPPHMRTDEWLRRWQRYWAVTEQLVEDSVA